MRLDLGLQSKLVRLRNELKAMKAASELAYSTMLMPENAPTASISGTIDFSTPTAVWARLVVTFTRTDGKTDTPYVDITTAATGDTFTAWVRRQTNGSVTGRDPEWATSRLFMTYAHAASDGSVEFYLDATDSGVWLPDGNNRANFSVSVSAISAVPGTLTIARLI